MNSLLEAALHPVLADLRTAEGLTPRIIDKPWSGIVGQYTAYLTDESAADASSAVAGSSVGIYVLADATAAERVATLADQAQEWAVEALWSHGLATTWPACPLHPASHPLQATAETGEAVWICPELGSPISAVGELAAVQHQ